ncbi:MAG TPA: LysR family transcriptional regulator [Dehalococcoidales bacterium]|nr:LysR family transcriptional regulator [Dehalococcoidales bacterium]
MAPSKLDLHSLIVFYYVASEESVTAAADKLCLTQPTVTYHIRSLEKNVGLKLLDIKRQKIFLTQAGAGLFKYVREIYQQMTSAERYLENIKEASLRVGISTTFSTCVASAASAFEKLYPHVRLIIRSSSSFEVVEDVLNSQVDLGIVVSMDYGNPKLKCIPLSSKERLVLVASPSSSIAQRERLEYVNLCGYPLILGPETSATRQIILKKLRVGGCAMPSPIIVEVNSSEWGINLVENGEGVGLQHIASVERSITEGRLKVLPLSGDIFVGVDAVLRADAPEHPMAERFIYLVREACEIKHVKSASRAAAKK